LSWVSRKDLAEGIAELLLCRSFEGKTLYLTGPGSMDIGDVTKILSRIRGCPMWRRIVPLDDYVEHLEENGRTAIDARHWATTYFGMALGEFGRIDPFLREILGRPLRTFEEVARTMPESVGSGK
jgi:uncharacterized protein YbjT (DUF2867 family)